MILIARLFIITLIVALCVAFPPLFFLWAAMWVLTLFFHLLADRIGG